MSLEPGESHLNRIEVGAVGRQEKEPASLLPERLCRTRAFVGGQVVEYDDDARGERRCGLCCDAGVEGNAVHGSCNDPGCDQCVLREPGNECQCSPFAEGGSAVHSTDKIIT